MIKIDKDTKFVFGLAIVASLIVVSYAFMPLVLNPPINAHVCTNAEKQVTACTLEYMPVCGNNNITYGNDCSACASRINYYVIGECK